MAYLVLHTLQPRLQHCAINFYWISLHCTDSQTSYSIMHKSHGQLLFGLNAFPSFYHKFNRSLCWTICANKLGRWLWSEYHEFFINLESSGFLLNFLFEFSQNVFNYFVFCIGNWLSHNNWMQKSKIFWTMTYRIWTTKYRIWLPWPTGFDPKNYT